MGNNKSITKDGKETALHYMKTLVEVSRESFLILDSNLIVISANPVFYQNFKVSSKETEDVSLYKLGNGQWNIPELKELLENILPNKKVVKDYEVTHEFETIGRKTILLNARQIDSVQLIVLSMEDISERKKLEEKLAQVTKGLGADIVRQTEELVTRVKELESLNKAMMGRELKMVELKKEIEDLKKQVKNGNGKNEKNGKGGKYN